ncbi:lipid A deacylase LpxR family protein [Winogradskyella sp.]|uniref:lipid A deacylase LpxR family protein n=1 Tax=Winogradskyella sp. TaxID=1883156 RepID=UPI0025E63F93|nr:lipid A deacylase LpxR family protein [Winogradskyella sp.]MBT8245408.1 lipid A deacylase LpxR family protein [Winogradskyella sp.]
MKNNFSFLLLLLSSFVLSQEKYAKEFKIITENDLYVSTKRDRYYTNGIFLNYRFVTKNKSEKIAKMIVEWEIGHEMYTPNKSTVTNINQHDRPFAGYLYGSYGISRIYKKQRIFNTSFQLGVLGSKAYGEEIQDFIHSIYGFKDVTGWKYQITNAIGLNFTSSYAHFLGKSKTDLSDITWINSGRIGTIYTDVSSGFLLRFGFLPLTSMVNSISFGSHLNNSNSDFVREVESYFFIKPMFRYAFYDATLQGSLFNNSSQVTKELVPFVFDLAIGIHFTARRVNFGYTFNYNTSKSEGLRYTYGNKYGSIALSYLIH